MFGLQDYEKAIVVVDDYFAFRGYKQPNLADALEYAKSEIQELFNANTKLKEGEWVRNNPLTANQALKVVADEIGDTFMMILKSIQLFSYELGDKWQEDNYISRFFEYPPMHISYPSNFSGLKQEYRDSSNITQIKIEICNIDMWITHIFVLASLKPTSLTTDHFLDLFESIQGLYKLAAKLDLDTPYQLMSDKFSSKGFVVHE